MKVLFDIGHPAHVHYFRNLAKLLAQNGHETLFTVKDKDIVTQLLKAYDLNYIVLGENKKGLIPKIVGMLVYTVRLFFVCKKYKPDILFNASPSAAFISWLMNKYHIALEDTFNMEQVNLYKPFTSVILTGDYDHVSLGKKEIRYPGYHELAYLHPNVFTPDESVLESLAVHKGEKYAIVRFVAWAATHDVGMKGMTYENKLKLVGELSKDMKVFISSEAELPEELEQYQIKIKPEDMHNVLAFASIIVGESATMSTECACLGVPAVYMDDVGRGYTDHLEKAYGLVYNYSESLEDQEKAINKAIEIVKKNDVYEYEEKKNQMLNEMIDVTSFMLWFVESYPESKHKMKQNKFNFDIFR